MTTTRDGRAEVRPGQVQALGRPEVEHEDDHNESSLVKAALEGNLIGNHSGHLPQKESHWTDFFLSLPYCSF